MLAVFVVSVAHQVKSIVGGLENARMLEEHLALMFTISQAGTGPFCYRIAPPGEL